MSSKTPDWIQIFRKRKPEHLKLLCLFLNLFPVLQKAARAAGGIPSTSSAPPNTQSWHRPSFPFVPLLSEATLWSCTSSTDYCTSPGRPCSARTKGSQGREQTGRVPPWCARSEKSRTAHPAPEPFPGCCRVPKEMDKTFTLKHS